MNLRPSSLPILKQSPKFVSGETAFAEEGTDRHTALRDHFAGDDGMLSLLDEESQEGIRWAAEYIRVKAPLSDYPVEWEKTIPIFLSDFTEMQGHVDALCHLDLFDFKWRERDYEPQMAAYALGVLDSHPPGTTLRAHLLFGHSRRAVVHEFDFERAAAVVEKIVAEANSAVACQPSDYCGWCAIKVECPVLNKRAQTVAAGREDWKLDQYHASAITEPGEMAKALALAKQLKKWAEGVEHFAKDMVIKRGQQIPGYKLQEKSGKRYCTDIQGAFKASGLPADKFLQCCDLRLATSKKDPNKIGLENLYKVETAAPSLAAAKREVAAKLAPFINKSEPSLSLVASGDESTSEE